VGQTIRDIMTTNIHCVSGDTSLLEVARLMRDERIGAVLVTDGDDKLRGIVTDRDLVVRGAAATRAFDKTKVVDICSSKLFELEPDASIDDAVQVMRDHAVRRVPVVDADDKPIGIVSIGDLARVKDPRSALAAISSATPNG
jgi:predicted transcriptional regulator